MKNGKTYRFNLQGANRLRATWLLLGASLITSATAIHAAPNFADSMKRPLHYRPDGASFVVENGAEFFNRPLYGTHTAFRVDAGDKPQLSFYLPGRGGNLRLGVRSGDKALWLDDARNIVTHYLPGAMTYDIRDPLLGAGSLHLDVFCFADTEGVIVRAELRGAAPQNLKLVWAYGGANGERASRDGDIGTEKLPVGQYFQFKSDYARNSQFTFKGDSFALRTKRADMVGFAPPNSQLSVADARDWNDLNALIQSAGAPTEASVALSQTILVPQQPLYLGLELTGGGEESKENARAPKASVAALPQLFAEAAQYRQKIASQITVETPDPWINAAVPALCVAADGVWDESQGIFMHGAVAWRRPYLGWRGAYAGDELGQSQRTRRHLMNWLPGQNASPIENSPLEPQPQSQDASVNLARNEPALHSNGDLTKSHYDMNLPAIDVLFRHLMWTGDLDFARENWPVIERHLAWERRLFRRPFGPDKLPLYEAYAAIWASDDLQYNGGGVAHASAYNYFHNLMAARVARQIGQNPAPYEREAALISQAMRRYLWLDSEGEFAEWRDSLGLQKAHEASGVWTFYHTLDSQVPDKQQAWQMADWIDAQTPHLPIQITDADAPRGDYFTVSTTNWMPYTWSINNVVMAESAHTALGYWQAGRAETAFNLFKGSLLDGMYLGLCPGNIGMTSYYDMARGEAQRDFADGIGATSRALVEGLFGVKPDALAGELRVEPGFPASWNRASIAHPNFNFRFERAGLRESYEIEPKFPVAMALRLRVAAPRDSIARVTINGKSAPWKRVEDAVGTPQIEIVSAPSARQNVEIVWRGRPLEKFSAPSVVAQGETLNANFDNLRVTQIADPQRALAASSVDKDNLSVQIGTKTGNHSVFVRVAQGEMQWWAPLNFETRPAFEISPATTQDADHLRFVVRNNTPQSWNRKVTIISGDQKFERNLQAPARGQSSEFELPAARLRPGSNRVIIEMRNAPTIEGMVTNWHIRAADNARWESVDLTNTFNNRVTQIFQNAYLSPRSPYVSLATPSQGIGSWARWDEKFEVDDAGLRNVARQNNDNLIMPQGVPLQTPGEVGANNIAFTSQWDNYSDAVTVPLSGRANHLYLLMAGSTNWMQSRFDNGEVVVNYTDGTSERLALRNPTNWWPIDQDYKIDDFAFRRPETIPPRVNLKTGEVRVLDVAAFKGKGGKVAGGAATVLDLPLRPDKELQSLEVRALANEVVVGLMSATLER